MKTLLLMLTACGGVTFTEPFNRSGQDAAAPDAEASTERLYVDMIPPRPGPKPQPQPSICPVLGTSCVPTSPFQETCENYESYWECKDSVWEDRWCGDFPAAICQGQHCVGTPDCP